MIQFSLKCSEGHTFDSWFQSTDAFDKLSASGMVACVVCGSSDVTKAIMAPRVRPARSAAKKTEPGTPPEPVSLSAPANSAEEALAEMRKQVEKNSDYVGMKFAEEARAMHNGDAPERSIYGEARLDEAKSLIDDGVPVAPLPFRPQRKMN